MTEPYGGSLPLPLSYSVLQVDTLYHELKNNRKKLHGGLATIVQVAACWMPHSQLQVWLLS